MEIELNGADETASTEASAANAANDGDTSEEDSLIDYNEEDEIEAAQKATERKALKEMLINNGLIYVEKPSQIRESETTLHFPIFERK
jgi:hypothetical protein